jgi:hypothetical protein
MAGKRLLSDYNEACPAKPLEPPETCRKASGPLLVWLDTNRSGLFAALSLLERNLMEQIVTHNKFEGQVRLLNEMHNALSRDYSALIHLFEHEYDETTKFWYGIADVNCTLEDIERDSEELRTPPSPSPASTIRIRIALDDGRVGWGVKLDAGVYQSGTGIDSQHTRWGFFGQSQLVIPPA